MVATVARRWTSRRPSPDGGLVATRRQTVDAITDAFHRLAADGYENFAKPKLPSAVV